MKSSHTQKKKCHATCVIWLILLACSSSVVLNTNKSVWNKTLNINIEKRFILFFFTIVISSNLTWHLGSKLVDKWLMFAE